MKEISKEKKIVLKPPLLMNYPLQIHTAIILIINVKSNYTTFIKITAKYMRKLFEFLFNKQDIRAHILLVIPM